MNITTRKQFVPIVLAFIILNGVIILLRSFLEAHGFDIDFLIVTNLILFVITFGSFFLQQKGLRSPNPHAFIRSVYAAFIFKLFVCIIAVLVYVFIHKEKINKPSLFSSMALYIVYTVIEVNALMKAARKNKNA